MCSKGQLLPDFLCCPSAEPIKIIFTSFEVFLNFFIRSFHVFRLNKCKHLERVSHTPGLSQFTLVLASKSSEEGLVICFVNIALISYRAGFSLTQSWSYRSVRVVGVAPSLSQQILLRISLW